MWLMTVVLWSHGETLRLRIKTLPVLLMNYQWSREQKWNWAWANTVPTLTSRKTPTAISAITRASCRRRAGSVLPKAENIGDFITAEHKVLSEESEARKNHRYSVVVQDWQNSGRKTQKSLMKFLEPTRKPKVIYTDNSSEFGKSCEELSRNHCTSTPHSSETNGIAKRAVRRVREGTSAVLLQSGLNENWWADSMECYTYLRNIQDLLSDGKTPFERRLGIPFNGQVIPFGAMVEYHPILRPIETTSIWP